MTLINKPFIFVGYDAKEDIAYRVCKRSILSKTSMDLKVLALKQYELRSKGLFNRPVDPLASTEFTYTRFLIPALMNYKGWAVFCDCDLLFLTDIKNLFENLSDEYAVYCVQHDYTPKEKHKMDGKQQTIYPRKNWSSLIVYNCSHKSNKKLTVDIANNETGSFLHQFKWLNDNEIGSLDERWNWLEGWTSQHNSKEPFAIHYTRGGPWFDEWQDVEYADLWIKEKNNYLEDKFNF